MFKSSKLPQNSWKFNDLMLYLVAPFFKKFANVLSSSIKLDLIFKFSFCGGPKSF
jgi:hypothetical protein